VKFEGAPLFSLFMPYLAFFALLFFKIGVNLIIAFFKKVCILLSEKNIQKYTIPFFIFNFGGY